MVGIVVVSHNRKLADEVVNFVNEMKRFDFPLLSAGGTEDGRFGSDPMKIKEVIEKAYIDEGVIVFGDIGSSILNAQMAIDFLDDKFDKSKVIIANAPIVEGALVAVSTNSDDKNSMKRILDELVQLKNFDKV
ncbi:MAG: PTS-dependent dihydroxyacetone kinase phosphotransferase subunit DhaM [Malacoplasma sp.]|nr:PTS-dependent dihydroxyacetone kinase phosphotransferase subunit DhaM [Malacoplasma sp.]MDE5841976.1 PTS-dependent dihydroxyacetone kinase phosphotransferase subunit DhaM [Malacoplasma sp.]MDE6082591.1 PTS-dependent dihydroxyacetone kinase phosphotransferase subunit DhaM [Malacoplasma sp.]MDE7112329.1 PTS-dependent dihydroxyacetone kinase phosphotransferase subunit DhaM [Malacoplasma sp.]